MIIDYNGLMTMALLVGVAAMAVIIAIMLDLASGRLFGNNGTGSFTLSNDRS